VKRLFHALSLTVVLASAPAFAQEGRQEPAGEHAAGEHEEHGIHPKTLGLQLFNFAVLLFLLIKYGGSALNKSLKERHEQLKADMEQAARLRTIAEARFKEQEQRLANLEGELEAMRQAILKEAASEKARIIAAAEERAKRVQDETRFQLDQQVKDAELRFRAEVAEAALKVAEELLRRQVNGSDEQRLVHGFVAELATLRPEKN
jgi:F-type H+-transporting ATPase subunit b